MSVTVINNIEYATYDLLGRGSFGSVYRAKRISDDWPVVIKDMMVDAPHARALEYEIAVLNWITRELGDDSPFNKILDSQIITLGDKVKASVVLEYVEGDNLADYWKKNKPSDKTERWSMIKNILEQVLLAINILHEQNIVHRDIKSQNVMVKSIDHAPGYRIIIIDFGLSCSINDGFLRDYPDLMERSRDCPSRIVGTPHYLAPQLIEMHRKRRNLNHEDLKRSDVWAIGIMLFQLIYGYFPHNGRNFNDVFANIMDHENPDRRFRLEMRDRPTPFNAVLDSIFVPIETRPTIRELITQVQRIA